MSNLFRTKIQKYFFWIKKIQKYFLISIYQFPLRKLLENALNTWSPILFHLKTYPRHI